MKVLLSWSGPRSKSMASALRDWLPNVIQSVDIWMSESDIDIGSRWGPDLDKELENSQFGILCLTPESIASPWIHYEAGALSKFVDKSHVCPYLLDLQPTDIKGPLVNFQAARANKEDTLKLLQTINHATADRILSEAQVFATFEKFWPDLEATLARIPPEAQGVTKPPRSQEDMIEEILKTVREQSRAMAEIQNRLVPSGIPSACTMKEYIPGYKGRRRFVSNCGDKQCEISVTGENPSDEIVMKIMNRFISIARPDLSMESASSVLGEVVDEYGLKSQLKLIQWGEDIARSELFFRAGFKARAIPRRSEDLSDEESS